MKFGNSIKNIKKRTDPNTLNNRWIKLARLAFGLAPNEESSELTQEPMFVPKILYKTSFLPVPIVSPATDIAIITEVVAELD